MAHSLPAKSTILAVPALLNNLAAERKGPTVQVTNSARGPRLRHRGATVNQPPPAAKFLPSKSY